MIKCRYRATGIIKRLGLVRCQLPQHTYKKAEQEHAAIENHLRREFSVAQANQVWCGDVTYIWAENRWSYLAVAMDLFFREPIGRAISHSPNSELTGKALTMAFDARGRPQSGKLLAGNSCKTNKPPRINPFRSLKVWQTLSKQRRNAGFRALKTKI